MKFSRFVTDEDKAEFREQVTEYTKDQISPERDDTIKTALGTICDRAYEIMIKEVSETAEGWLTSLDLDINIDTTDRDDNPTDPDGKIGLYVSCSAAFDVQYSTTLEDLLKEKLAGVDDPIHARDFYARTLRILADKIENHWIPVR